MRHKMVRSEEKRHKYALPGEKRHANLHSPKKKKTPAKADLNTMANKDDAGCLLR
jgi:hypothetical protein